MLGEGSLCIGLGGGVCMGRSGGRGMYRWIWGEGSLHSCGGGLYV